MQRALILENEKANVKINTNTEVVDIKKIKDKFEIYLKNNNKIVSDKIILSTGSKAAPKTGSDGFGYNICKNLKHTVIKPLPALVQLQANEVFLKDWEGIRTEVLITLYENNKKLTEERGEIQLTNYGISGICVFNLSGRVARGLEENKKERIEINFLEGLNIKTQDEFIKWMNNKNITVKNRTIFEILEGVLNYKLVNVLLKISNINNQRKWEELDYKKRKKLLKIL